MTSNSYNAGDVSANWTWCKNMVQMSTFSLKNMFMLLHIVFISITQYIIDCNEISTVPEVTIILAGHPYTLEGKDYILEV